MIRVVLTGGECTGKTTLAQRLAAQYGTVYSPEHSRVYAIQVNRELAAADVEPIAHGQLGGEDSARVALRSLIFHDTDLISTVVYARHYYGACPAWIETAARARRAELYLLCHPDVAWVADPQRDRGERREEMHALFTAALQEFGCRTAEIHGDWNAREAQAAAAVGELLRR